MKLSVDLKNCYGIKALQYTFDFDACNAFPLYAPNGTMKTSFARVFRDISEGTDPQDAIFQERLTSCSVLDEVGTPIDPERIFIVNPYDEEFSSERVSTLLVNKELKARFETIHALIERDTDALFLNVGKLAGLKTNIEEELAFAFGTKPSDIYALLEKLGPTIRKSTPELANIIYTEIFNEKAANFLSSEGIHVLLKEYIDKYNELIDNSRYFRKGLFNHNNASTISKNLKDNGFFAAKHSISLTDQKGTKQELANQKDFDSAIAEEKNRILTDSELVKRFDAIDKAITKNAELRALRVYIENNPKIIPELGNLSSLKRKLWVSYLGENNEQYLKLMETYKNGKRELTSIVKSAKEQATLWQKVVEIFNDRFSVPFILEVTNQDDVILRDQEPSLVFKYRDGADRREIERNELLAVLSTGEKRALYILNVIFEVEARAQDQQQTLLIIDDIADSFDYKNKFAIIEYLKDIVEKGQFLVILLTHNFDFFRTVQSRLSIRRENCLMAIKDENSIRLVTADYLNPFPYWKGRLHCDDNCLIAAIPMVRNLIEYSQGRQSADYLLLTALLHRRPNTDLITMVDLTTVMNRTLSANVIPRNGNAVSLIFQQAGQCLIAPESINLENKVVLSIAIRLAAETLMINKINDAVSTDAIVKNQTRQLFELYKTKYPTDGTSIKTLERVAMITPEAIHLNSFMYEPLIDISDYHLKELYTTVKSLTAASGITV